MRIISTLALILLLFACGGGDKVKYNPKAAKINAKLGFGYMGQGILEVAEVKFKHATKLDAQLVSPYYGLGLLYEKQGKVKLAEIFFRDALKLDSSHPEANNNFGTFLCRQGRYKESEFHFRRAIKNKSYASPEKAYVNAGLCMKKIPNFSKARYYFRKGLELDPRQSKALFHMADLSYHEKKFLSARAFLDRFMEFKEISDEVLWLGIKIERALGDTQAARIYWHRLIKEFPQSKYSKALKKHRKKGKSRKIPRVKSPKTASTQGPKKKKNINEFLETVE